MIVVQEKSWNDLKPYKTFLEHYGREGMKWYQHIYGKRQSHAKYADKSSSSSNKKTSQRTKEEKQKAKAEKKAADEAAKKEKQRKDNLTSPTKLYKHRKEYTYDEINNAIKRFDLEKRLADLSQSNLDRGARFIKSFVDYTENGVKLYNNAAKIINSLNGNDALKIIKDSDKKDKSSDESKKIDDAMKKLNEAQRKFNEEKYKFESQKLADERKQFEEEKKKYDKGKKSKK